MLITALAKNNQKQAKVNQSQVNQRFYDILQLTCHICACPYDSQQNIPMIVCPEQHTFCSVCVGQLFSYRSTAQKCPTCRAFIVQNSAYVNKTLLRICDIVPNIAQEFDSLTLENKRLKEKMKKMERETLALRGEEEDQKENAKNGNIKVQDLEKYFPRLKEIDDMRKPSKLDLKGFLARKRMSSNKQAKLYEKKMENSRNKMKSIHS